MYKLQAEEVTGKSHRKAQKSIPMTIHLSVTENSLLVPVARRLDSLVSIGRSLSRTKPENKAEVNPSPGTGLLAL
jgi:hypothetical protein